MKNKPLFVILVTVGFAVLVVRPSLGQEEGRALPFLRIEGSRFVNEEGAPVVLRGVSFSDPDRLAQTEHWNRAYFEAAKSWGANVVRFPAHPRAWRERGDRAYLDLLDQGIAWAAELRLYVIIDWHSIGNLRTELFQHPMYNTTMTETLRFWNRILRKEGHIVDGLGIRPCLVTAAHR